MLIPQFTIRRLFWLVTICAAFFGVVTLAVRGVEVARSLVAMIAMLAFCFFVFAMTYTTAVVVARLRPRRPPVTDSPFARDVLPPRYVAPENE